MPRIPLMALVMLFGFAVHADPVHAQPGGRDSVFYFAARLVDSVDKKPVQFAHIVNTELGLATISDTFGYFYIRASPMQELWISAIGFSMKKLDLNDSLLEMGHIPVIYLEPFIYPIGSVTVNPLGNYRQFRQRLLETRPAEPAYSISPPVLMDIEKGMDTIVRQSPSPIANPVTFFYDLWSKEGKSQRKLAALIEEEQFAEQIANKYNPDLVSRITGFKGLELYEFMEFCNFSKKFLLEANDYQIVVSILDKKRSFLESGEGGSHD